MSAQFVNNLGGSNSGDGAHSHGHGGHSHGGDHGHTHEHLDDAGKQSLSFTHEVQLLTRGKVNTQSVISPITARGTSRNVVSLLVSAGELVYSPTS